MWEEIFHFVVLMTFIIFMSILIVFLTGYIQPFRYTSTDTQDQICYTNAYRVKFFNQVECMRKL